MLSKLTIFDDPLLDRQIEEIVHTLNIQTISVAPIEIPDNNIEISGLNIWVDEGTSELVFKIKLSTGTIKSGRITLT